MIISTASSGETPVVSTMIASEACVSGNVGDGYRCGRGAAHPPISLPGCFYRPRPCSSLQRRWARSSAVASIYNFSGASGIITVPISRPTITTRPFAPIFRCRRANSWRTPWYADTCETWAFTSAWRNAQVTSSSSSKTVYSLPSVSFPCRQYLQS